MTSRRKRQIVCWFVIAVLYLISVPWYRDPDQELRLLLGLPDWVATALLCYVGVAIANSVAWLDSDLSDDMPISEILPRDESEAGP